MSPEDKGNKNEKNEPRLTFFCPIQYSMKKEPEKFLKGIVNNISKSGMNIYSFNPLSEGQEIVVTSTLPNAHNEYIVCWSRRLMEDFYVAGLKSTD